MAGPPLTPIYYPFASVPSVSNSNVFPYDVVINEAYPGIILNGTEAGAVYSVIREVDGCLWFVLNADYDQTTLEWTQEDPTNPNTPAYAMELCAAGTWNWYYGAPTLIPGSPITWISYFLINAEGALISTPATVTGTGNTSQDINVTWNAGALSSVIVRNINLTDTSSAVNSYFDQFVRNSTVVWAVDKFGVLQVGTVPVARITGLTPFPGFNNVTLTGTTTVSGPADFNGPVVMTDGLTVTGAETVDTLTVTGNLTVGTIGGTTNLETNTTNTGFLNVDGSFSALGGATLSSANVTGNSVFHGTVENGSGGPVVGLTSSDDSINVVASGGNYTINVNTEVSNGAFATWASGPQTFTNFSPFTTLPGTASYGLQITFTGDFPASTTVTITAGTSGTWNFTRLNTPHSTVFTMSGGTAQSFFLGGSGTGGTIPNFTIVFSGPTNVYGGVQSQVTLTAIATPA
jgi:hypothetical protein